MQSSKKQHQSKPLIDCVTIISAILACCNSAAYGDQYDPMFKSAAPPLNGGCNASISPLLVHDALKRQIELFLERNDSCINSFSAIIGLRDGYPALTGMKPTPNKRSLFYAEEAIWTIPRGLISPTVDFDYKFEPSPQKMEKGISQVVSLYLIPLDAATNYFSEAELNSSTNKKELELSKLDTNRLKALRQERYDFFKNHAHEIDRESVSKFQNYLAEKYSSMFM